MGKYNGKYAGTGPKRWRIPLVSWVLILAAVLSLAIGGVVAYLSASTGAVTNDFSADAATDPEIQEDFDGSHKTNVAVDVGDPGYAVYVRAALVITWKNSAGEVLGTAPVAGTDYDLALGSDWVKGSDGFYYYRYPVAYDGTDASSLTGNLITSCEPVADKTPAGYGLNVEIVAQTIQALGTTDITDDGNDANDEIPAVQDAWGVSVDSNGVLTPG